MIKLYTNKELSEKLGINLAKWKRWSREFLPPDPLGGMQSGFTRQYYFNDAFHVMLGGHLVGDLRFSVYEARMIIEALKDWLAEKGFYMHPGQLPETQHASSETITYRIFIQYHPEKKQMDFSYRIRGVLSDTPVQQNDMAARDERYIETIIRSGDRPSVDDGVVFEKLLDITALYEVFIRRLEFKKA